MKVARLIQLVMVAIASSMHRTCLCEEAARHAGASAPLLTGAQLKRMDLRPFE